jgi:hypothetical protein
MPSTQVTAIEKTDAGYVCQLDNGQTVTGDVRFASRVSYIRSVLTSHVHDYPYRL